MRMSPELLVNDQYGIAATPLRSSKSQALIMSSAPHCFPARMQKKIYWPWLDISKTANRITFRIFAPAKHLNRTFPTIPDSTQQIRFSSSATHFRISPFNYASIRAPHECGACYNDAQSDFYVHLHTPFIVCVDRGIGVSCHNDSCVAPCKTVQKKRPSHSPRFIGRSTDIHCRGLVCAASGAAQLCHAANHDVPCTRWITRVPANLERPHVSWQTIWHGTCRQHRHGPCHAPLRTHGSERHGASPTDRQRSHQRNHPWRVG